MTVTSVAVASVASALSVASVAVAQSGMSASALSVDFRQSFNSSHVIPHSTEAAHSLGQTIQRLPPLPTPIAPKECVPQLEHLQNSRCSHYSLPWKNLTFTLHVCTLINIGTVHTQC